jgi:malate dehydrogenase
MPDVAILGAGPIGSAVAHALACRARVREVRLIDANSSVSAGKALDIMQSGPVLGFDTLVSGAADPLAAVGSPVIVIADPFEHGEWRGESGLAMVQGLVRAGATGAFVFAGPGQMELMEMCFREARVPADRMVGTAASAMVSAVQALAALEVDLARVEVMVVGRPPAFVVGWSAATVAGALLTDRVPAHRLLAISDSLRRLWPPGAYAIGAATARVVEALINGSRQLHAGLVILEDRDGRRGQASMLPLELGRGLVLRRIAPSLSQAEGSYLFSTDPRS